MCQIPAGQPVGLSWDTGWSRSREKNFFGSSDYQSQSQWGWEWEDWDYSSKCSSSFCDFQESEKAPEIIMEAYSGLLFQIKGEKAFLYEEAPEDRR